MTHTATGLNNAWTKATTPEPTPAEIADLNRRREEDFKFMVLCAAKGNMAMYHLLRDKSLDKKP